MREQFRSQATLKVALLAALCVAVIGLYIPGLSGPFMFDDGPNIVDNGFLTGSKASLLDWWAAAQSSAAGALRRPVSMLSIALQTHDPESVSSYALKAGNLAVHLLCGLLIYRLSLRLIQFSNSSATSDRYKALPLIACALWLLNPLHASTVLYPIQRMAQLTTLFCLLGLNSYVYYRVRWLNAAPKADEVFALCLWVGLCTFMAVFSKENGIVLPALIAVLEATLFRGQWAGSYKPRLALLTDAVLILGLGVGALLLYLQWDWIKAGYDYRSFTLEERLWTQARLLWNYAGWFALPRPGELGLFHDDYPLSTAWLHPWTTLPAVVAWGGALILGLVFRHRYRWVLFAVAFFLVAHFLESGPLALELVFEHRNYLPSVSIAILLAALLCDLVEKARQATGLRALRLFPALLVVFYALSLVSRTDTWSSEMKLASETYARHPQSVRSAHYYAITLIKEFQKPGVAPQTVSEYLAVARHEFEVLHNQNTLELSTLIMLYTLDSRYFRDIVDPDRWLRGIEASVASSQLLATEYAAMRVFLYCFRDGFCKTDRARIEAILDTFERRYTHVHASAQLRLLYLEIMEEPESETEAVLRKAVADSPWRTDFHYQIIQSELAAGDFPSAHLSIVELLRNDPKRRQLSIAHKVFLNSRAQ